MSEADIEQVLLSREEIAARVRTMADEIARSFAGREIVAVGVLTGAVLFLADLVRHIPNPVRLAFVKASSYGRGTRPGELALSILGDGDFAGRDLLVVDDILDSGRTLRAIVGLLSGSNPRSLRTAVLLDKKARREVDFEADFVGFAVPDRFLVGYGLDHAELYRNLPYVGVLRRSAEGTAR